MYKDSLEPGKIYYHEINIKPIKVESINISRKDYLSGSLIVINLIY